LEQPLSAIFKHQNLLTVVGVLMGMTVLACVAWPTGRNHTHRTESTVIQNAIESRLRLEWLVHLSVVAVTHAREIVKEIAYGVYFVGVRVMSASASPAPVGPLRALLSLTAILLSWLSIFLLVILLLLPAASPCDMSRSCMISVLLKPSWLL